MTAGCLGSGLAVCRWNVIRLEETISTNDDVRRLAIDGAPECTAVVAEYQTAGRGRLGRRWEAPAGSSLLLSILLRPEIGAERVPELAMICGLAVADCVEQEVGLRVGLKWPNDIVWEGQKLGGILSEVALRGSRIEYAVLGIGLNVNLDPARLPGTVLLPATSLSHVMGRPVSREALLQALLQAAGARYASLRRGASPYEEWAARQQMLHRPVTVFTEDGCWEGYAEGVDGSGALLVRRAGGSVQRVVAGDVSLGPGADWQAGSRSAIIVPGISGDREG